MSKFDELFKNIISEMNINLAKEAVCKPNTMLNQAALDAKKIPEERKAKVIVKQDGNTTGISYNVDSDTSAEYMADNIKANGGDATIIPGSGVTNEDSEEVADITELTPGETFAQQAEAVPFDKNKYEQFLAEGKQLGIDAVSQYLQEHSAEVSDDFDFSEAPEEEYFVEYALVKYNAEEEIPEI